MASKAQQSSFKFKPSSWLKNSLAYSLGDGTQTWAGLDKLPEFIPRETDLFITLDTELRPEQIAKDVYGMYELWWIICVANGIRMPLSGLYPGRTIRVPDPDVILEQIRRDGVVRG